MAGEILRVEDLHTHIAGFHILQGVNFKVSANTVTAILGRNGVGKTTTLKTIMGIYRPSKGRVIFQDEDITGLPTHIITRKGISFVPSERNVFASLTVEENLKLAYTGSREKFKEKLELVYSFFPELRTFSTLMAGELSGGQQRMLALACGMIREHSLLILDEPSEGLSPMYVKNFFRKLKNFIGKNGRTVLLIEQNFAYAKEIVDYLYLMDKGTVVAGFPASEIGQRKEIIQKILGVKI